MRIPQIRLRYGLETFLTRRVPQLQFNNVIIYFDLLDFEIDAYRTILQRIEVVFSKPQQHGRLTAPRIAEHNYLIQSCNFFRLNFFGIDANTFSQQRVSLRFLVNYVACNICMITIIGLVVIEFLKIVISILIVKPCIAAHRKAIDILVECRSTFFLHRRPLI